jgi:MSHA biogenesis protein MshN
MSIINQMLQKLEQRRGGRDGSMPDGVRAVAAVAASNNRRPLLLGVLAAIVLAGGGFYGWTRWQLHAKPVKSVAVAGKIPATATLPITPAPLPMAKKEEEKPPAEIAESPPEAPIKQAEKQLHKRKKQPYASEMMAQAKEGKPDEIVPAKPMESSQSSTDKPSRKSVGKIRIARDGQDQAIKSVTPQQQALFHYQKALSWLQQGRVAEARSDLEDSLKLDPQLLAARQALAGLLVEQRQYQQAELLLQEGLNLNAEQYSFAMALARLQVERGDTRSALDTLYKSLPHAADNAGYQAFLAALLQRSEQHKKAIEHYQAALRLAPSGAWQMGLGISLQAENRLAEAQEAFGRAKDSNGLSSDLLTFVEQRLRMIKKLLQQQSDKSDSK